MPISKYNPYFGGNAEKALQNLIKEYGQKKGESIFYALVAKRKKAQGGGKENSN